MIDLVVPSAMVRMAVCVPVGSPAGSTPTFRVDGEVPLRMNRSIKVPFNCIYTVPNYVYMNRLSRAFDKPTDLAYSPATIVDHGFGVVSLTHTIFKLLDFLNAVGINQLKKQIKELADPDQAAQLQRFFKTGPGGYGEGDRFLGLRMPQLRKLVKGHLEMPLMDVEKLLRSHIHEHRMAALLMLTYRYPKADMDGQVEIYRFYLDNTAWINNWDLVDVTVPHIVGAHLMTRSRKVLYQLAKSKNLWERRISIVATAYFIRQDQFEDTLNIAALLLDDDHDLIHKAVGWMLREVGKRDEKVMEDFLLPRYQSMPRTMLRYAIEKLPEPRRRAYLKGTL